MNAHQPARTIAPPASRLPIASKKSPVALTAPATAMSNFARFSVTVLR